MQVVSKSVASSDAGNANTSVNFIGVPSLIFWIMQKEPIGNWGICFSERVTLASLLVFSYEMERFRCFSNKFVSFRSQGKLTRRKNLEDESSQWETSHLWLQMCYGRRSIMSCDMKSTMINGTKTIPLSHIPKVNIVGGVASTKQPKQMHLWILWRLPSWILRVMQKAPLRSLL